MELTDREIRLVRYALGFLQSSLDRDLSIEAGQEIAPETQITGEALPDVPEAIQSMCPLNGRGCALSSGAASWELSG